MDIRMIIPLIIKLLPFMILFGFLRMLLSFAEGFGK